MADNPFARFAPPGTLVDNPASNPFARFAAPEPAAPAIPGAEYGLDFTKSKDEVRTAIAALPADQQKKAFKAWGTHYVANEKRTQGQSRWDSFNNAAEAVARGTPIGSFGDEIDAGLKHAAHAITGGTIGAPYQESVAYNRARQKAYDAENPKASLGLKLSGGLATMALSPAINLFKGAAVAGPVVGGVQTVARKAPGMLKKMGNGAVTGAAYGGVYGAGLGEDTASDHVKEIAKGVAMGGGIGAAAVPVAVGLGNSVKYVADKFRSVPPELAGKHRVAADQLVDAAKQDRLLGAPGQHAPYATKKAELGPESMLADMGHNMRFKAMGVGGQGGDGATLMTDRLAARNTGARDRITRDVNEVIGPELDLVQLGRHVTDTANKAAKPHYDAFYNSNVQLPSELAPLLERFAATGAVKEAGRRLQWKGLDPNTPTNNGQFLDQIKRATGDMIDTAQRSGSNEAARDLTLMNQELRAVVDKLLNPANPAMSSWAQARRLSGEGKSFNEALETGKAALAKNTNPDQLKFDLAGRDAIEAAGHTMGARQFVRDVMGKAASARGSTEESLAASQAMRKAFGSDYAKENLRTVLSHPVDTSGAPSLVFPKLGNGNAGQLFNRANREAVFAETNHAVTGNSITAKRTAAINSIPGSKGTTGDVPTIPHSWGEAAWKAGRFAANAVTGGHMQRRADQIAYDMADMLTKQGKSRDAVVQGLMKYAERAGLRKEMRDSLINRANALMNAPRGALIDDESRATASGRR